MVSWVVEEEVDMQDLLRVEEEYHAYIHAYTTFEAENNNFIFNLGLLHPTTPQNTWVSPNKTDSVGWHGLYFNAYFHIFNWISVLSDILVLLLLPRNDKQSQIW